MREWPYVGSMKQYPDIQFSFIEAVYSGPSYARASGWCGQANVTRSSRGQFYCDK